MRHLSTSYRLAAVAGLLGMLAFVGCDRTPVSPDMPGASATVSEDPPPENPGTGTPGYWKNHPDAWPTEKVGVGDEIYWKADAIEMLGWPEKGDKTLTIFRAVVAAKLNVAIGNDDSCIAGTIDAAETWMNEYGPAGSGVKANSDAWQMSWTTDKKTYPSGEDLYEKLDDYNNGELCAPSRDSLEE